MSLSAAMYKLRHSLYFRHLYCEEILILDIRHINKVADWKCFFSFVFLPPLFDKQPACCQFIIYQTSRLRDILWRHHLLVYENENTKTAHAVCCCFFFSITHTRVAPPLHMLPIESIMTGEFRLICWQGLTTAGHVAQHAWLPASSAAADRS